tara:strand:- start:6267 stop:7775 length:1509 start_codon:yes stop_codon:yes gene_type:complete
MCVGGQDIPVTLRVAGGVEGGKWKSEEDVRATPPIEEEVESTETTEVTEPVEPSAPLYKPVIDRINQLSEKLPDKVAGETVQEMQPMMHHGWGMNDRNHHHTMRMLDRIMRNTSRRPRPPRPGGPGKWGGGDPRIQVMPKPQLVANQQLAGLAGLFGRPQQPRYNERTGGDPNISGPMQFPQQPTQQPMQPEVIEEQEQQMEILGQPKQFAGGGIVNALMATPIGQSAIQEYARGGDITFDSYKHDYGLTGDPLKDILEGLIYNKGTDKERPARFYGSREWLDDPSKGSVVDWSLEEEEDETPTLKSVRKILKPKKKEEEHQDSYDPDSDKSNLNQPTLLGPIGRGLVGLLPGGAFLGALADRHAVGKAMGTSPYARSLQPSFFDHLTMGMFDTSGLYDKMVENMSYGNPYGRHGETSVEGAKQQSPLHDYTHSYGNEDEIEAYSPDLSTASGQAVADIAAAQEAAAVASQDADMSPSGEQSGEGLGGDHDDSEAGEMGDDD